MRTSLVPTLSLHERTVPRDDLLFYRHHLRNRVRESSAISVHASEVAQSLGLTEEELHRLLKEREEAESAFAKAHADALAQNWTPEYEAAAKFADEIADSIAAAQKEAERVLDLF